MVRDLHQKLVQKSILLFFISILFATSFYGQNRNDKHLIKKLDELISENYKSIAPGCAVIVTKGGQIVYKKAFGIANLELNVPMRPDMIFRIGSVSKQYTAIVILQLVEQGKIALQDSIQKYVKDFPSKGYTITIENLLTHTSGITDYQAITD